MSLDRGWFEGITGTLHWQKDNCWFGITSEEENHILVEKMKTKRESGKTEKWCLKLALASHRAMRLYLAAGIQEETGKYEIRRMIL